MGQNGLSKEIVSVINRCLILYKCLILFPSLSNWVTIKAASQTVL